jgi:hypothetical protein
MFLLIGYWFCFAVNLLIYLILSTLKMYLPNRVDIIHNVSDAKSKESMASTNVIVAILVFMLAVCFVLQILYFE